MIWKRLLLIIFKIRKCNWNALISKHKITCYVWEQVFYVWLRKIEINFTANWGHFKGHQMFKHYKINEKINYIHSTQYAVKHIKVLILLCNLQCFTFDISLPNELSSLVESAEVWTKIQKQTNDRAGLPLRSADSIATNVDHSTIKWGFLPEIRD